MTNVYYNHLVALRALNRAGLSSVPAKCRGHITQSNLAKKAMMAKGTCMPSLTFRGNGK